VSFLCTAQNHSWSPESFVVCLSISSGGNLLYIPVERETLFRVSLAAPIGAFRSQFGAREERKLVSVVRSKIHVFLAKPLRVADGAVKVVSSLVKFELACFRSYPSV
jgi:hypothetical protein